MEQQWNFENHQSPSIIKYVSRKGVTISGIQRFLQKSLPPPLTKPLWEKLYVKCKKMAKIDSKCNIINPIYDDTISRKAASKFIRKLATINVIFQKNQSILH